MVDILVARRKSHHSSPPGHVFWIIFAGERRLTRPLTLSLGRGKEALAVFSNEEEAEILLRSFATAGEGWRVRQTSAGEVISLLYGPCCAAKAVTLDPLPQLLADGFLSLVALERRRSVRWVMSRKWARYCVTPVSGMPARAPPRASCAREHRGCSRDKH